MDSALNGNIDAIALALEAGINPDLTDENGRTPLMLAGFNGHTEIAERLLEAGARVDLRD
ncbi:MAG: ankyrin repeat domain-containing protein [Opitutales bacterium]|nr:ankyrin repeat domain-containing protein [Opitutales bacterium]